MEKEKNLEWKDVDGETIIFNRKTSEFFVLNKTGSFIWEKINGKNTEKKIVHALAEKFKVNKNKAEKDTKEMIKKLKKMKLAKN